MSYFLKAVVVLVEILQNSEDDAELCAAAWTLGHIAKHSPQHSLAVAVANALPRLLQVCKHTLILPYSFNYHILVRFHQIELNFNRLQRYGCCFIFSVYYMKKYCMCLNFLVIH